MTIAYDGRGFGVIWSTEHRCELGTQAHTCTTYSMNSACFNFLEYNEIDIFIFYT